MNKPILDHSPLTVTVENFDELVTDCDIPVLIEVWSPSCIPCNLMKRAVKSASETFAGEVRVGLVNAQQQPKIVADFGAQSTPMFYLVTGGQVVDAFGGMCTAGALVHKVRQRLADG